MAYGLLAETPDPSDTDAPALRLARIAEAIGQPICVYCLEIMAHHLEMATSSHVRRWYDPDGALRRQACSALLLSLRGAGAASGPALDAPPTLHCHVSLPPLLRRSVADAGGAVIPSKGVGYVAAMTRHRYSQIKTGTGAS